MRETVHRADFLQSQRTAAWSAGWLLRDDLLDRYCTKYHLSEPPPPALIVAELITDFLGARLEYVALPWNVFAETEWTTCEVVVRVNSQTARMSNVKDAEGVQRVAAWHECIHLTEHGPSIRQPGQMLPGFEAPNRVVCRRGEEMNKSSVQASKEFRAEEAGRAAAISHYHLQRSEAFLELMYWGNRLTRGRAWRCLYQAAADISVNSNALVKQLSAEGLIVLELVDGARTVRVQPALLLEEPV
jgi:hypothetical protein